MMGTGSKIASAAMTWLGTPYHDNAMAKGHGVDCAHLLLGSLLTAGLVKENDITIGYYSNEWHLHRSEELFLKHVKEVAYEVPLSDMQIGDFLLYQYGRCVSHGAILVDKNTIIHAYVGLGVILSTLGDVILHDNTGKSRLRHVYRWKGDN